ncbi:hypothetical protein O181_079011 [Austropuccinia psidii MF-1]|uniref:Uncharacterized protein n=1 Tax=Austropuccinia psidii MF-1 TaxID=1389203 RepID=A0A9Q3FFE8_9BASI|nr:hypothetical protein [Austropuccinia psidii MF-1]
MMAAYGLRPEMSKSRCCGQMDIEHHRGPIGHKRYGVANWPQLGSGLELPQHPWRRVNLCGCDTSQVGPVHLDFFVFLSLSYPLSPLHPPAKNTRSQRNTAVLTPTARVPLDRTPSAHQLSANLNRAPPMEGEAPSRRGGMKSRISRLFSGLLGGYTGISEGARARLGKVEDKEGEESVEGEDAFANSPEVPQGSNLAPTNKPLVSQSDPSLFKIMEQMATIMGQISQAAAPSDNSKDPEFKTP